MHKEYIEREAALSAQNKSMNLAECRKRLERLPAADVALVSHGWWENGHCTRCGEDVASRLDIWTNIQRFSFCPFCGARMDGDGE